MVFAGAEFDEQVEDHGVDFVDAGVGPVDLVDDDDRLETAGEGFAEHEPRLRQRSFGRVDQEENTVGHFEDALDFAAEVGVPGGVDEVDFDVAQADRAVLGQNRDAALALLVVGVHDEAVLAPHELVEFFAAEEARLPEHLIDEGRFAVVDVGDDGDVADVGALHGASMLLQRVVDSTIDHCRDVSCNWEGVFARGFREGLADKNRPRGDRSRIADGVDAHPLFLRVSSIDHDSDRVRMVDVQIIETTDSERV